MDREEVKAGTDRRTKADPAQVKVDTAHIKEQTQESEEIQAANTKVEFSEPDL